MPHHKFGIYHEVCGSVCGVCVWCVRVQSFHRHCPHTDRCWHSFLELRL